MDILNARLPEAMPPPPRRVGPALDVYDRDTGLPLGRFVGHAGRAVIIAPANGAQIVRRATSVYLEEVRA